MLIYHVGNNSKTQPPSLELGKQNKSELLKPRNLEEGPLRAEIWTFDDGELA